MTRRRHSGQSVRAGEKLFVDYAGRHAFLLPKRGGRDRK